MSAQNAGRRFVSAVVALTGLLTLTAGIWEYNSATIGLGLMLLLTLIWADAISVVLTGFLVAGTLHAIEHFADPDRDGTLGVAILLATVSVLAGLALWQRLRHVGYVVGAVRPASDPRLAPFVRQKTVSLTTYRKNGQPGRTPVSIAVDGDRAYVRSFEKSLKTRRLARTPEVLVAASTGRGDITGTPVPARMRRLDGAEYRRAARMMRRKHPMLHGVLVPLAHRVGRAKTGRTVHFELVPTEPTVMRQDETDGRGTDSAAGPRAAGRG